MPWATPAECSVSRWWLLHHSPWREIAAGNSALCHCWVRLEDSKRIWQRSSHIIPLLRHEPADRRGFMFIFRQKKVIIYSTDAPHAMISQEAVYPPDSGCDPSKAICGSGKHTSRLFPPLAWLPKPSQLDNHSIRSPARLLQMNRNHISHMSRYAAESHYSGRACCFHTTMMYIMYKRAALITAFTAHIYTHSGHECRIIAFM